MIDLTEEQIERYSRHILLQDVGLEGQEKLLNAKVLIIGAGGLGSPVALYLAAAGVGHIGIVDADVVDLSNLQRQVIHQTKDLNTPKVESAKEKMIAINPDVEVTTYHTFLASDNAEEIISHGISSSMPQTTSLRSSSSMMPVCAWARHSRMAAS